MKKKPTLLEKAKAIKSGRESVMGSYSTYRPQDLELVLAYLDGGLHLKQICKVKGMNYSQSTNYIYRVLRWGVLKGKLVYSK